MLDVPDHTFSCALLSGKVERGEVKFVAGIRQRPDDISLVVSDLDQAALIGSKLTLFVDEVEIGQYDISSRIDDQGPMHTIGATVPADQRPRVLNLFRSGGAVKFVTQRSTFAFPLNGASVALQNMRECMIEVANLAPNPQ